MKAREEFLTQIQDRELNMLANNLITLREREEIPEPLAREQTRARVLALQIQGAVFETRLGWMALAFDSNGIVGLELPRESRADALRALAHDFPNTALGLAPREMIRELEEYAAGKRRVFDLPLNWSRIKPFQRAVLTAIQNIPFGETRSYGWVAHAIGKPRASRAVGAALGANPIPIILPCHRVIGSDGGLHGYGGGLDLKARLLRLEGALQ